MPNLSDTHRQHIIELLQRGEDLPLDYKHLLFPPERQEYELVYAGKEREEDILAETMAVPLQPIRTFGGNGNDWHNMLIFGDNLQAMKTLLKMKEQGQLVNADGSRGVKLVYIDPPFATKQEFQGTQDERAYQDKIAGARFVEFLRNRLVLIRELMCDEGVLFIHLDYRKAHYLKVVLDELLGEQNFRNEIIVKRITKNLQRQFEKIENLPQGHDTLFWYSKRASSRFQPLLVEHETGNHEGYWKDFWSNADRPTMRYPLVGVTPTTGQWKWKRERAQIAVANYEQWQKEFSNLPLVDYWRMQDGQIEFIRKSPSGKIEHWIAPSSNKLADTVWTDISAYQSQKDYPTQKSEELLARLIENFSSELDIVLDAFAGSGTTLAVAEKLRRRWIGIDCGKLAIYTIQKRMLNLKSEIGNKGKSLKPKPFTLYNAGLYDFARLKELPWDGWRSYALGLFQCQDKPHKVAGIQLDGFRGGNDVLVFNHTLGGGVVLDYGFIDDLHAQIGSRIGSRFFIIAPAASVTFLEDYVEKGRTRYYILRIPYSIINELHNRDFSAITQPVDETQVNETVEAVGFDFIRQPKVECEYSTRQRTGEMFKDAVVEIKTFKSQAMAKGASQKGNRETLSMVLVDYDYPHDPKRTGKGSPPPFEVDAVFYANDIQTANWEVQLSLDSLGEYVMLIYVDIYGNEYTEIKTPADFGNGRRKNSSKRK
jgi:site-specific DNA-methyltransferase (adenine-specific)/adenine-specific DNA-methyltransferase